MPYLGARYSNPQGLRDVSQRDGVAGPLQGPLIQAAVAGRERHGLSM